MHGRQGFVRQPLLELQRDLRVLLRQRDQHAAQPQRHRIDHRAEAHHALRRAAQLVGGRLHAHGRGQRALGLFEQAPAGRGRRHAARRALEQAHAEFVFERLELRAGGRGAGEHAFRGAGQVALLRDGDEGLQLVQLHDRGL
ncbi:hypothetical protein FQZ97_811830 [compost metagenome]